MNPFCFSQERCRVEKQPHSLKYRWELKFTIPEKKTAADKVEARMHARLPNIRTVRAYHHIWTPLSKKEKKEKRKQWQNEMKWFETGRE